VLVRPRDSSRSKHHGRGTAERETQISLPGSTKTFISAITRRAEDDDVEVGVDVDVKKPEDRVL
jgi:hypothetical protein